jgi:hypothetical protein
MLFEAEEGEGEEGEGEGRGWLQLRTTRTFFFAIRNQKKCTIFSTFRNAEA